MRINRYLSICGIASRRTADELIRSGRVSVYREDSLHIARIGDEVTEGEVVYVDGTEVKGPQKKRYIAYHKPVGVSCTALDRDPSNIMARVDVKEKVSYAGRLDKDSTGLVFLTNDGDLLYALTRPAGAHEKEYICEVDRAIDGDMLQQMANGVMIDGRMSAPCKTRKTGTNTFHIVLTEGRNRQIRKMCAALGYGVRRLHRIRIATLMLGDLEEDTYRDLTTKEIHALRSGCHLDS